MSEFPILSLLTFLPLAGALFILTIRDKDAEIVARNARYVALWATSINFLLSYQQHADESLNYP